MAAAADASVILRNVTAFLDEAVAQPDRRHRILSSARRLPASADTLRALDLFTEALPSSSPSAPNPTPLRAAEKLLLSLPSPDPLSALLLSLIHSLRRRTVPAALSLLQLFALDPSAARQEIAPSLFEDLFIPHLIPVLQWFSDQRSLLLPSGSSLTLEDDSRSIEATAAMNLLSRMSGGQAVELKKLEQGYEEVLDANSRVYAQYLKQVLEASDGFREPPGPPQLIQMKINGDAAGEEDDVAMEEGDD